jgi:hypothetical protein
MVRYRLRLVPKRKNGRRARRTARCVMERVLGLTLAAVLARILPSTPRWAR